MANLTTRNSPNRLLLTFTRERTEIFAVWILLSAVFFTTTSCNEDNAPPNIIIFFTDDQGYADVGSYGAEGFETPHLDQLASEGLRFTNFYVPATVCTPSRAGLLTGRYPRRSNLHEAVLFPYSETGLKQEEFTLAEMLKESGYTTTIIGKWHLGHLEQFMPDKHGFDHYFGVPYSNDMDGYYYNRLEFQSPPLPLYRNEELVDEGPDQRFLTKRYTEEAISRIQERGSQPFFLYLAHNMPHLPLHRSPDFEGISEKGVYGDVIMELDWSVGELIKTLKDEGIYDNTIFIFTSDNGPRVGSAKPLRGLKATTWEGGQRVPGIISWPARIPANVTSDEMVSTMDLFPTLATLSGSEIPEGLTLDGQDLSKLLAAPASAKISERPFYYFARNGKVEAVRKGQWKLHIEKTIGWNKQENGDFPVSLFNLNDDIGEQNNLADEHPDVVNEMTRLIQDFNAEF